MSALDGVDVEEPARIQIAFPDWSDALVTTRCADLAATMYVDTDGELLEFAAFQGSTDACPPDVLERQGKVIEALEGTESWRIDGEQHIELVGTHIVRLERIYTRPDAS